MPIRNITDLDGINHICHHIYEWFGVVVVVRGLCHSR